MVPEWTAAAAVASPHILYAFIWLLPGVWLALFARNSKRAVYAFECVQAGSLLWWYSQRNPQGLSIDMDRVALYQWLAFVALAGMGQALNLSIYDAIGSEGVYYGTRLGLHVPWHKGFPFTFVAHPQYVGSVMTVWAVVVVLFNQGPAGSGLIALASYWTGLYTVTSLQEQYL